MKKNNSNSSRPNSRPITPSKERFSMLTSKSSFLKSNFKF